MGEPLELRIGNTLAALTAATDQLARWLSAHDVPTAAAAVAHMGVEELVTNCIKYGYDDAREHVINVSVSIADGRIAVRVADDGRPFDPVNAPPPDLSLPPDQRPLGGLGLHLLRTMSDRMTYERRDGLNRVTIEKTLA